MIFRVEGDLDPKVELEFLENGSSSLGTITIPVFPGAVIDIQDITIEDKFPKDDYYINIGLEGQVDSKNCVDDSSPRGTIQIKISSEDNETEVTVNLTSATDIRKRRRTGSPVRRDSRGTQSRGRREATQRRNRRSRIS